MNPTKMSPLALPPIVQGTPAHYPLTPAYAPYMSPISNYNYGADEEGGESDDKRIFGVKVAHIAYGAAILAAAYGAYRFLK